MHGIRKIYAWYEIWINDGCVAVYRQAPLQTDKSIFEVAARHWCNVTNTTYPVILQ